MGKLITLVLFLAVFSLFTYGFSNPVPVFADKDDDKKPKMMEMKYSKEKKKATTIRETLDLDSDGIVDVDITIKKPKNPKNPVKVNYKISDSCVHGSTYDTAAFKLGFSDQAFVPERTWFTEGFKVWNKWFLSKKSSDPNHQIDLIVLPVGKVPVPFPASGDNVIQKNPDDKKGSFKHKPMIKILDRQAGWAGTVFFTGPPGDYFFWTIFPAEGLDAPCDTVAAFGIDLTLDTPIDNKKIDDNWEEEDDE
jgi:hypothetical protein